MRAPYVIQQVALNKAIVAILTAQGLTAETFDSGHNYPTVGVTVTDPREPKAIWEFTPSSVEGDPSGWLYQIGTYMGDEYEGVVFEYMSHHLTPESTAEQVAREIAQTIGHGIDAEDQAKIILAYAAMIGERDD